ncbi:MarR family transcriptional regulator [Paenibacillus cisolokensis]|uniref:MarR family winged helix-turn-helix transcriptional regulator n=1 Tax=Paenibacillus cisolokensis TaxID=1658519 RepID=UPI003D285674
MDDKVKEWIDRYVNVHSFVVRRINARIREELGETLTDDQYQIMLLINDIPKCTPSQLAEMFSVGKSSITAIVNRLVQAGMVERTRDESDRRIIYLSITDHGRFIFDSCRKQIRELISPYLQHFEEEEIESFISKFEKLGELMQEGGRKN